MKTVREFTKKEVECKEQFYKARGSTEVHIYNPIVKVGDLRIGDKVTFGNGRVYKIHSFGDDAKPYLRLLTKDGKADNRTKGIRANITTHLLKIPTT